ncbi:MAG TPA: NIPSNAP family protein [Mycobacteriales bacterium]|nr:NIPSNAP family protein [Mycobacteriales bacterium]
MDLPVVELRRYTLVPGRRDEMIDVFERHLMESQQDTGMYVLGTFRDLDRPDHFVWLRGFPDMGSRKDSLTAFYSGPVWKEYGPVVRPTMVDTDDVHLLRPVGPGLSPGPLPPVGAEPPGGIVYVTFAATPDAFATFVTEKAENTYPALPVHEGVDVTVSLTRTPPPGPAGPGGPAGPAGPTAPAGPAGPTAPAGAPARLTPTARSPLR